MEQLFFELIRVAIGTQNTLSRPPSRNEWAELYTMAKKQSLVGICFAAVQKLQCNDNQKPRTKNPQSEPTNNQEPSTQNPQPNSTQNQEPRTQNLDEVQYLTWMGMAAKIQQRNEVVNRQCVELQAKLSADGLRSCVLKGQGVAQCYAESLRGLRQTGDIDAWVNAPKEQVVAWAEKVGMTEEPGYLHVGCNVFSETEVELHYRPTYCRCLWYNKRLQEFCEEHKNDYEVRGGIVVPSWEFDVVYQLSHIYRHLFGIGIGLRQLMDYYFVLQAADEGRKTKDQELPQTLKHLGLYDFAGAVMYVMREVFHLEEKYMIVPVDERRGRALLRDVMQSGNFGKMDKEQQKARESVAGSLWYKLKRGWELIRFYPSETLSVPVWNVYKRFVD